MIKQTLYIGSWTADFFFAPDGYDSDRIINCMYDWGASRDTRLEALNLMESGKDNTGFTFCNPHEHYALVAIGPTSTNSEFLDTLTHEVHHLAVNIASELGVDLESEVPAYISGDAARALAEVVCRLGCPCNHT